MCICASIYLFVHLLYMYYMCNFGQRSVCLKTLVLPRGSSASLRKKYLFSDTKVWCCIPQRQFTHKITFLRGSSVLKDLVLHFPEEVYSHNNFSHSSSLKALMLHSPETAHGWFCVPWFALCLLHSKNPGKVLRIPKKILAGVLHHL